MTGQGRKQLDSWPWFYQICWEGSQVIKRLQGRNFTPEHLSAYAHVVGFHPPPVTSLVVQRTGAMPHCPWPWANQRGRGIENRHFFQDRAGFHISLKLLSYRSALHQWDCRNIRDRFIEQIGCKMPGKFCCMFKVSFAPLRNAISRTMAHAAALQRQTLCNYVHE